MWRLLLALFGKTIVVVVDGLETAQHETAEIAKDGALTRGHAALGYEFVQSDDGIDCVDSAYAGDYVGSGYAEQRRAWTTEAALSIFKGSMVELALLGVLALVLVYSNTLSRRSTPAADELTE